MWIALMGPMRVTQRNIELAVPPGRLRTVLAALLLRANQAVSVDGLAAVAWDGQPPAGASVTIRSYVKRLRRALGPELGGRIVTRYPGYLIEVAEDELDVLRFGRLCQAGRAAVHAHRWQPAFDILTTALGLWRGTPLLDVPAPGLQRDEVPPLEDLWLDAIEWRTDAALNLDMYDEVAANLQRVTRQHPLRERLHAQLMLALAGAGRQADALGVYRHARQLLRDELGVEPGPSLREAHQSVLRGDLGPGPRGEPRPRRAGGTVRPGGAVPRGGPGPCPARPGPSGGPEPCPARPGPSGRALLDLFSRTEDAMVAIDSVSRIVAWNDAATSLFGHAREDVLGRCCAEVLRWRDRHGNAVCGHDCVVSRQAGTGRPGSTLQLMARTCSGQALWVSVSSLVLPREYHHICQVVHFMREVSFTPLEEAVVGFARGPGWRRGSAQGRAPTPGGLSVRE
jgi:PAS domain S-box-containing protein